MNFYSIFVLINFYGYRNVCHSSPTSPWGQYQSYLVIINMCVSFIAPVVLLVWLYRRIYEAAQGNSERARRTSLAGVNHEGGESRNISLAPSR